MEVLPGSDLSDRVDRDAHLEGNVISLLWGMWRLRFMCDSRREPCPGQLGHRF